MTRYLLFPTQTESSNARQWIQDRGWFPADNGMTTSWADNDQQTTDGKWGFPGIPPERLIANNIPDSEVNLFFVENPSVEVRDIEATDIVAEEV